MIPWSTYHNTVWSHEVHTMPAERICYTQLKRAVFRLFSIVGAVVVFSTQPKPHCSGCTLDIFQYDKWQLCVPCSNSYKDLCYRRCTAVDCTHPSYAYISDTSETIMWNNVPRYGGVGWTDGHDLHVLLNAGLTDPTVVGSPRAYTGALSRHDAWF